MKRIVELLALAAALGMIVAVGWTREGEEPSTFSTYDTGPNGYEALYNVLRNEGVKVTRLTEPLGMMPAWVRVLATTPALTPYDRGDVKRLRSFIARGGRVVAFRSGDETYPKGTVVLDARGFTNSALERRPAAALRAYRALAGRGLVAFDEHRQGYGTDRTLWSVMPPAVRIACGIVVLVLVLALIGANVRFAPAIAREPPGDRDSSAYIVAMARLLRRAGAAHVAIPRKDRS